MGATEGSQVKILLVDDEEVFLEQLKEALEHAGLNLQIETAGDGLEALEKFETVHHDIVITDLKMPRMDGYTLLKEIHKLCPSTYVVVITCLLYTSPSPRDRTRSRMPSSA